MRRVKRLMSGMGPNLWPYWIPRFIGIFNSEYETWIWQAEDCRASKTFPMIPNLTNFLGTGRRKSSFQFLRISLGKWTSSEKPFKSIKICARKFHIFWFQYRHVTWTDANTVVQIWSWMKNRWHRYWWRMLETKCLDNKFKMLVTDSRWWWPI